MSVSRKMSCYHPQEEEELSTPSPTTGDPDVLRMLVENSQAQGLSNEISAPYELPKFPIEQLEYKLKDVRKNSVCPSGATQVGDDDDFVNETFVPHFQRVNISGEDITGMKRDNERWCQSV